MFFKNLDRVRSIQIMEAKRADNVGACYTGLFLGIYIIIVTIPLAFSYYSIAFSTLETLLIGHFRGIFCLCAKTSLRAKPLMEICVSPTCLFSCL